VKTIRNAEDSRPRLPPFDREAAIKKVRLAEDAWNTRDPEKVAPAYTTRFVKEERTPTQGEQPAMNTKSYAGRSDASPLASFSLRHRDPLPDDLLIEVRF
jgi:hypothetical protein